MDEVSLLEFSLRQDDLGPLFNISNLTELEESFQSLIEVSKTDVGRSDLASRNIIPTVLRLSESHLHPFDHQQLILSLRLLRNLCAGEAANQKCFIDQSGCQIVSTILMSICSSSDPDCGVIRVGLQVLANVVLAGEEHKHVVWRELFPEKFLVLARVRSQGTCDALCKIICFCCDGNPKLFAELSDGLSILTEIVQTASEVGFEEHWFKSLLSVICFQGPCFILPLMFSELHPIFTSKRGNDMFSSKQAYVLGIISENLNEQIGEMIVPSNFALFILEIFNRCVKVIDSVDGGKSDLSVDTVTVDILGYSLQILRDICSQDDIKASEEGSAGAVDMLLSCGLLEMLLSLLRDLEPPAMIRKLRKQGEDQDITIGSKIRPYKGCRRDIVAVIGNCTYGRKHVQDKIRGLNGIFLLLQQCVVDEDNPFLREWSIWCIRNLLQDNSENQKVVKELELQQTVDVPEIAQLGLRVEVDQKTGRAKLVNVS